MAHFSLNKLPKKERIQLIGEFYNAVGLLKNRKEAALVFRDILEPDEIGNIMRRIDVAILLMLGFTYEEIVYLLGVGKNKVERVQRKMNTSKGGYELLLKRVLEQRKGRRMYQIRQKRKWQRKRDGGEVERLKQRYPSYFLFWNIIDEVGDYFSVQEEAGDTKKAAIQYYEARKGK